MRCRFLALVLLFSWLGAARAATVYVNKNVAGDNHDGVSWSTAFPTVQAGLNAAAQGSGEVWVAQAVYTENVTLPDGVGLFGGFTGTETRRSARNAATNVTTLQGDNTASVVTIPATAGPATTLDGFTITKGRGNVVGTDSGGYKDYAGGGVCCLGSAIISNNVITGNHVYADSARCGSGGQYSCLAGGGWGGGIYCGSGKPIIQGNDLHGNFSDTHGGGVYCDGGAPVISNNAVSSNSADFGGAFVGDEPGYGSGIACYNSNALITHNTVSGNGNAEYGGGNYSIGGSPAITYNTITANHAFYCGGVYITGGVCSYNHITGNRGYFTGGGIYALGTVVVRGNVFDSNQSSDTTSQYDVGGKGGGVYAGAGVTVVSNFFTGNSSGGLGGGCYAAGADVFNNTFFHNTALNGGALVLEAGSRVVNNIAFQNSSGLYASSTVAAPVVLAQAIGANVVFSNTYQTGEANDLTYEYGGALTDQTGARGNIAIDPAFANASGGDFHLSAASPAMDAGADNFVAAGDTDLDGKARIIGAHVDMGAYESGETGPITRTVYVNKNATGAAPDGASWASAFQTVQAGVDAANSWDEVWVAAAVYAENVTLRNGVALYGGFAGGETARGQRNPANAAILDGGGHGTVVTVPAAVTQPAILNGFTVRNGAGGSGQAGGIQVAGSAVITGNTISGNSTGSYGGGVCVLAGGTATLANNVISGNKAGGFGGGVYVGGRATLANDTIAANQAALGGGVFVSGSAHANVANTIIAFNSSGLLQNGGALTLRNNDVYGNTEYDVRGAANPTGTAGNVTVDPHFADLSSGDYHLAPGSPCRDAGLDAVVSFGQTDRDGTPRLLGAHADIGAYEENVLCVNANATGAKQDGLSWSTAFHTVRGGASAAAPGQEVWVAASAPAAPAYVESFGVPSGVALYGGFNGTETGRSQRNWKANPTILDGNKQYSVVDLLGSVNLACTLDGFTVRNGLDTIYPNQPSENGSGITASGRAVIANDVITGNALKYYYDIDYPVPAPHTGSGIYVGGTATITNCLLYGNSNGSGVICVPSGAAASIVNTTISNNGDNGVYVGIGAGSVGITNTILSFNNNAGISYEGTSGAPVTLESSDVYANASGNYRGIADLTGSAGNIAASPLFADALHFDYVLQSRSPCIDSGDDAALTGGETDLNAQPRKQGDHVDMGAYEAPAVRIPLFSDAFRALSIASGLAKATPDDVARLDVESGGASTGVVDVRDAVRLLRASDGLAP